jgi:mRNA-degrading endonuclease RelE of RelBE toxin-antitoxin system
LYRVELLQRARRQLEELPARDEAAVSAVLHQLALNPRPRSYWICEEDEDVNYIYLEEDRGRMVTYEIEDRDNVVYVHSIDVRPSRKFDPR